MYASIIPSVSIIVQQTTKTIMHFVVHSMKFGTLIAKGSPKRFGYGAIINFQHGAHDRHFSKWLPATTFL